MCNLLNLSDQQQITKAFQKHGLVVKMTGRSQFPGEWPLDGPKEALRLTFHMFNTNEDVKKLVTSLSEIISSD